MKKLFVLWKEGWREGKYFIKFFLYFYFSLFVLFLPIGIVASFIEEGIRLSAITLLWLIFGFPFIVHWASQGSGFRAPSKEKEALEIERQAEKTYEEIRRRNS